MNEQQKRENTLYLVVPCYNEEEVLLHTAEVMLVKLKRLIKEGKISSKSKVMFVNDGSVIIHGTLSMLYVNRVFSSPV